jgi:hypothetical protein
MFTCLYLRRHLPVDAGWLDYPVSDQYGSMYVQWSGVNWSGT